MVRNIGIVLSLLGVLGTILTLLTDNMRFSLIGSLFGFSSVIAGLYMSYKANKKAKETKQD